MKSQGTGKSIPNFISRKQYFDTLTVCELEIRRDLYPDLELDQEKVMPNLFQQYTCVREIDRLARLLAVLNWITDTNDVTFPVVRVIKESQSLDQNIVDRKESISKYTARKPEPQETCCARHGT